MSITTKLIASLVLASLVCGSAQAQELYFRNKPYKGPRTGKWEQVMVGLKEAALIFDLPVSEEGGAFVVGDPPENAPSAGQVVVNGTVLTSQPGESGPMVNLKELSAAAELTYKLNKDLGGIDVTKPAAKGKKGGASFYAEGVPNYISQNDPGADADVDSKAVRGKVTLAFLYASSYSDKGYQERVAGVDQLAAIEGVILLKFPKGPKSSPLFQKYPNDSPFIYVFDRRGKFRTRAGGHGISYPTIISIIEKLKKEP